MYLQRKWLQDVYYLIIMSCQNDGWWICIEFDWNLIGISTKFAGQLRECYSPRLLLTLPTSGATTATATTATTVEAPLGNRHVPWVCSAGRRRQRRRRHRRHRSRRRRIRSQRVEKPTDRRRHLPISLTRSIRPPQDRKRPHRRLRWRRPWRLRRLLRPRRPARSHRCVDWPKVAAPIKITATPSVRIAVKWASILNQ